MEGDSEIQAPGNVAACDREGVGDPQSHHQEIHGCRRASRAGGPGRLSLRQDLIQWRHNKVTFMLAFDTPMGKDIGVGQALLASLAFSAASNVS